VIDDDGEVRVSRTAPGRGAWICGTDCVDAATARRGFDRAWRRTVSAEVLATITDVVAAMETTAVRSGSTRHERLTTRVKG
jgi:predicted RNA-binding protein YlxR (DUF448 family)